jgi:hypothetical protein
MSHDYHVSLPGYSEAQILHDGCGECEARSASLSDAIARLDHANFIRAWMRATQWNRDGLSDLSQAERPLLSTLWAIQLQFERLGVPIGTLPAGVSA